MAIGRTNTGGSAKAFAVIVVDYPAGSICTCTNGTKTLTAENTSGNWAFLLPSGGDWAVRSRTPDGTYSAERNFVDVREKQALTATLTYNLIVWDAAKGIGSLDEWTHDSRTTVLSDGSIETGCQDSTGNGAVAMATRSIDMTGYRTIKIYVSVRTGKDTGHGAAYFKIMKNIGDAWNANPVAQTNAPTVGEYSIDISALSGTYAIRLWAQGYYTDTRIACASITLER